MAQQLHGLTHTTTSLDAMRQQNGTSLLAHLTQAQTDAATGRKELSQALHSLRAELSGTLGVMSGTLNERLAAIQSDNSAKLEEMRRTVDEKLHATLEQRLGESFKLVSERLEQVQHGLGEMKSLAASVGDLKRVMTNVKSRGTWGEMQLGASIENVLTIDQYGKNGNSTASGAVSRLGAALNPRKNPRPARGNALICRVATKMCRPGAALPRSQPESPLCLFTS